MIRALKRLARKLPGIRDVIADRDRLLGERDELLVEREQLGRRRDELQEERDRLASERDALGAEKEELLDELEGLRRTQGFVPPGHFYSPIPSLEQVLAAEQRIFADPPRRLEGIPMDEEGQLRLLRELRAFHDDQPFGAEKREGLRYYFDNPAYSWSDAILLHGMMRFLKPRRIIEVGSGFSSCMMLDTNDRFFDGGIDITFVEPFPELLNSLIRPSDREHTAIVDSPLQEVGLEVFDALEADDILFIDSTHVSRIDSDVNRILFDILPRLKPGVYVHFHDILWPFEYPREWVMEGRAWNEAYALRAFLQFNPAFRVVLMNTFMQRFHREFFERHLPLCLKNTGGSLWLRKESVS
jgi:predicted O-methyltransferase YrrM